MKSAVTHRFHCAPGTGLCSQSWRVSWPSCCGSCSVVWRVLTAWTLLRLKPGGGSTRATTSGRTAWLGTAGAGVSAEDITKSVYRKKSRLQYRVKGWFLNIFQVCLRGCNSDWTCPGIKDKFPPSSLLLQSQGVLAWICLESPARKVKKELAFAIWFCLFCMMGDVM